MEANVAGSVGNNRFYFTQNLKGSHELAHAYISTHTATISISLYGDGSACVMHYDDGKDHVLYRGPANRGCKTKKAPMDRDRWSTNVLTWLNGRIPMLTILHEGRPHVVWLPSDGISIEDAVARFAQENNIDIEDEATLEKYDAEVEEDKWSRD